MRLANDSPSFTPVPSQIRAIGPRDLHFAKGRGQTEAQPLHSRFISTAKGKEHGKGSASQDIHAQ
jgi:hypothetical protein